MTCLKCPHQEYREGLCYRCWREASDPAFAAFYRGMAPAPLKAGKKRPALKPCVHQGNPTGVLHTCPSCTGFVQVKEFACLIHERCTLVKQVDGLACCIGCKDRNIPISVEK